MATANTYRVIYVTTGGDTKSVPIHATTAANAWAGAKAQDSTASVLTSVSQLDHNAYVGS